MELSHVRTWSAMQTDFCCSFTMVSFFFVFSLGNFIADWILHSFAFCTCRLGLLVSRLQRKLPRDMHISHTFPYNINSWHILLDSDIFKYLKQQLGNLCPHCDFVHSVHFGNGWYTVAGGLFVYVASILGLHDIILRLYGARRINHQGFRWRI